MDVKTRTRELILEAAERLFAERGIENVSLREIGAAAGQRNNSAVQYHFGTRDELVRALCEARLAPLNRRRIALLAALPGGGSAQEADLRELVEAYITPLAETVRDNPRTSSYARFVQRFTIGGPPLADTLDDEYVSGIREVNRHVAARLTHLPPDVRADRMRLMTLTVTAAMADTERRLEQGLELPLPFDALTANLIDCAVGLLLGAPGR
jgi:AcrR family transcriptional regulator